MTKGFSLARSTKYQELMPDPFDDPFDGPFDKELGALATRLERAGSADLSHPSAVAGMEKVA
jgi:hypothetical protein